MSGSRISGSISISFGRPPEKILCPSKPLSDRCLPPSAKATKPSIIHSGGHAYPEDLANLALRVRPPKVTVSKLSYFAEERVSE